MLQRIQTVYLLLVVALMLTTLFLPLAVITAGDVIYAFDAMGLSTMLNQPELVSPAWGLFALTAAVSLIALVTIFLFKSRITQIRLCVFNAFLMLGFYGLFAFLVWTFKGEMPGAVVGLKFGLALPAVSLILNYLAIRNIGADEALVRSLDRLR